MDDEYEKAIDKTVIVVIIILRPTISYQSQSNFLAGRKGPIPTSTRMLCGI